jgi:glycosyltransferase involved in cell wall biosynthesis
VTATAPRLSIGMPVRNGEQWVARAITSLLEQDFEDFVLVVSDNGSTDGTATVVQDLAARDPRVRYVRQPVDHGGAWNFNEVFRLRDPGSEFFKWAAADDRHRPGFLSATIAVLDAQPDVVVAHCRTVDVVGAAQEEVLAPESPEGHDPDVVRRFRAYTHHRHSAFQQFGVIRAAVLEQTALLAPFSDSDLSLLAEISLHGRLVDVDEVLFERYVHDSQSTATHRTRRQRMAWFDPDAADRVVLLPTAMMGRELLRAIDRAPLTAAQRRGCRRQLLGWVADSRLRFANDVASSARAAVERAVRRVRRAG